MSPLEKRRKVLVADDYPDAAEAMVALLRVSGYEAAAAFDGVQALEAVRRFQPELVIMDIDMPQMSGLEAARLMRMEQPLGARLILIAHSGRTTPVDVRAALEAGFDRHIGKPLFGQDLCDLVAAYLPATGPQSIRTIQSAPGRAAAPDLPGLAPYDRAPE